MTEYKLQVTVKNLFNDVSGIKKEYSKALKIYTDEAHFTTINRALRLTPLQTKLVSLKRRVFPKSEDSDYKNVATSDLFTTSEYKLYEGEALDALGKIIKLFDNEDITRHVFPRKIDLYRSIKYRFLPDFTKEIYTLHEDKAFTSTSTSYDFIFKFKEGDIDTFKTKLHLLPGLTYRTISLSDYHSNSPSEKEVLMNRGCVYFYIGKKDKTHIYEFILLPNMETYQKIGKQKLMKLGSELLKESSDILDSTLLLEKELSKKAKENKRVYIDELTYLIQLFITKDILTSPKFYDSFKDEVSLLQTTLFNLVYLEPIYKYFPSSRYFIERQISYISWFIYLIDNGLLTSPNSNLKLINDVELLNKQSNMRDGLVAQLKDLETYYLNNGGALRSVSP